MKGIIIASFGSIYQDAVEKSIGSIEKKVRSMYSDMEVRRVFLSDALVEKWNEKYEDKISSFTEAMQDFARMGIDEVYIQPITLVADQCYQQMRKQALKFLHSNEYGFSQVNIGKPLLTSLGVKNYADDYEATLESIVRHVNTKALNKSVVLMANGQNQLEFSTLQLKAMYGAAPNVVVLPLALIGSTHLMDYLGGERSDSIYALLAEEGYNVDIWNEGLGENPYVQDLFLKHLGQAIRMSDRKRPMPRESVKPVMTNSRLEAQGLIS
ncbi:MAG: sirohydrochlorin cobaltochelatase [Veillonella sp.]|nr:sirohydrochlorin cobaltochelatase [Veillonella sp.]